MFESGITLEHTWGTLGVMPLSTPDSAAVLGILVQGCVFSLAAAFSIPPAHGFRTHFKWEDFSVSPDSALPTGSQK